MVSAQYRIIEKIGEGGMGVVYKAEHVPLERIVALKTLPPELSSHAEIRERFIREAKIQARLSHPNVVGLYNFFEQSGNFYLVMEYVQGESLEALIKRSGPLSIKQCMALFSQVLSGIGYAHTRGVIHRDIKPSNIMIMPDGTVKVTDFGIAKIVGDLQRTQTGVKVGTIKYMSPEQVSGHPVDIPSDIYSLGVTLFQMVTGKVPFEGDSGYHVMKAIMESPPPSPKDLRPDLPVEIDRVITKALSKEPGNRFQSTTEFMASLSSVCLWEADQPSVPVESKSGPVEAGPFKRPFGLHSGPHVGLRRALFILIPILVIGSFLFVYLSPTPKTSPPVKTGAPHTEVPGGQTAAPPKEPEAVKERPPVSEAPPLQREPTARPKGADKPSYDNLLSSAKSRHKRGDYDEAIELYLKVLDLDPKNAEALRGLEKARKAKAAEVEIGTMRK